MNEGQSLYELVVAIAIMALFAMAVVSLATSSIQNSTYSKNQSLASSYAQEATEWLRGQRDANINNFIPVLNFLVRRMEKMDCRPLPTEIHPGLQNKNCNHPRILFVVAL